MGKSPEENAAAQVSLHTNQEDQFIGLPRASSLYKACMRMHVLGTKLKRVQREYLTLRERLVFGFGNAIHYWIQNSRDVFGDKRYGWWRCSACGERLYFGPPPAIKLKKHRCPKCKAAEEAIVYDEHALRIKDPYYVTGHPDMFLLFDTVLRVVELKTIRGDVFSGLIVPLIEHVWQVHAYMWGLEQKPIQKADFDLSKAYIVYISKIVRPGEFPIKSFTVERDERIMKRIFDKLDLYKNGMQDYPKNLPPKNKVCARNQGCYEARTCPVVIECFSRKD